MEILYSKEILEVMRNWDAYCAGDWVPEWKKNLENPKELIELDNWAKKGIDLSAILKVFEIKEDPLVYYI